MSRMRWVGTIGATAIATLAGTTAAPAAVITVPAGDAAALVAAINTANANGEADTLRISGSYQLGAVDNYWYGPNVLPAITSDITIEGNSASGARIQGTASDRGRLFYVSGGRSGLSAGTLRLRDLELRGGRALGGNSTFGGGGAGMGGGIFNQGTVDLQRVTLAGNRATGGAAATVNSLSGGGIGQDAQNAGGGGGFGGAVSGGGAGGAGTALNVGGGGGGGGYEAGEDGAAGGFPVGGAGGGVANGQGGAVASGTLGGRGTGAGGRAANGSGAGGAGGAFGVGGALGVQPGPNINRGGGGGGGVGGGGAGAGPGMGGGGGGFGGGGGWANIDSGDGGFGGGAAGVDGRNVNSRVPVGGFGGGDAASPPSDAISIGGGGAGMGGAVFNDGGTVTAINSTFSDNTATGGLSSVAFIGGAVTASGGGDGLGSALFNLNGTVTLTHVTLAGNTATGGTGEQNGESGTALANVAYDRATARQASITAFDSAVDGAPLAVTPATTADGGTNLAARSTMLVDTTVSGTLDLAPLGDYGGPTATMAPNPGSPLIDAVTGTDTALDQRGFARSGTRDRGAVEAVSTTLSVTDRMTPYSASAQNVNLTTTVSPARGAASPGAVTFGVTGVSGSIAPTIAGGIASGNFSVPGGTAPGTYPITASAAAAPGFLARTGSGTLRILKPPLVCSGVTANTAYQTAVTVDPDCVGMVSGDTVAVLGTPANGTATVVSDRLRYAPDAGYFGSDSFTYTVTNEGGVSNTATVSVTVAPAVPACAAVPVDAVAGRSTAVTLSCTSAVAQTYAVVDPPDHGTLGTLDPVAGTLTYTADVGYDGPDSFAYRSTNAGGTSNIATVSVTVAPAEPDCAAVPVDAVAGRSVGVSLSCTSAVAQTYAVVDGPDHGTLGTLDPVAGTVTYTADAGYDGPDSFTYRSANAGGTSNTATVSVTVAPAEPDCAAVPVDAVAGRSTAVTLACTSAVAQTFAVVDQPAHGTLSALDAATGELTYTADAGYDGPDSFTYRSTNAGGTSNTATVSVTVAPAEPDCAAADVDAGSGKPTAVTLTCTSAVAQTYAVVDPPEHGTLGTLDPTTGELTYTSDPGYVGSDSFTYRSTNAGGTSSTATVDVDVHPAPTVTVTPSADVELGSGTLAASAAVVGRYAPDGDATVDFRLYRPDDATCSATPVYERLGVEYPVAGGTVESGTFAPTVAGVHRWRVTYSGDRMNVAAESACDAAPVTVTARPVVPPVDDPKPPVEEPPPAPEQCGAELVLLDVAATAHGRRARVSGIARPALAGQTVTILRNGRSVGTTRVQANGSWSATVRGPGSARSRPWYAATTSRTRTGALRLFRRMTIEQRSGLRATGRITMPAGLRPRTVRIDRVDVCSGQRTSTTARVSRAGAFTVRLAPPATNEPYALFRVSAVLADRSQTYTTMLAVPR